MSYWEITSEEAYADPTLFDPIQYEIEDEPEDLFDAEEAYQERRHEEWIRGMSL